MHKAIHNYEFNVHDVYIQSVQIFKDYSLHMTIK